MAIERPESTHGEELEQELEDISMLEGVVHAEHERIGLLHEEAFETAELLRKRYDL